MFEEVMDTIGFVSARDPEVGAAMEREMKRLRGNGVPKSKLELYGRVPA